MDIGKSELLKVGLTFLRASSGAVGTGGEFAINVSKYRNGCLCMKVSIDRQDVDPLSILTNWYEFLHRPQLLEVGLQRLAKDLGAWAVCLSRHSRELVGAPEVLTSGEPEIISSSADVDRSYAHCVLGIYIDRPRAGSVWLSSAVQERINTRLQECQAKHNISELAVIPLTIGNKQIDYLELHFARPVSDEAAALLNALADALGRAWISRSPGLFVQAIEVAREN